MSRLDIYTGFYDSPIGCIELNGTEKGLCGLRFIDAACPDRPMPALLAEACQQIDEYFQGQRLHFNIPLDLPGTDFQVKVWTALTDIPAGSTPTYQEIANSIEAPTAALAVGATIKNNPVAIVVPCHRVTPPAGIPVHYTWGNERYNYLTDLENPKVATTSL